MKIVPITFRTASEFVKKNHRHLDSTIGCKFCIGVVKEEQLIGVAICGRPVSRFLDDGKTIEINRVCVLENHKNACSKLYSACCRIAKEMGYQRAITYILESENGASVKASNFISEGLAGGKHWTGVRNTGVNTPKEMKIRFSKKLT